VPSKGLPGDRLLRQGRALLTIERARKPYCPHLGIVAPPRGVSGRVRGQAARLELAGMGVAFVAEEDPAAPHVLVLVDGARGVPVVGGELVVGAGEEVVALLLVLAHEEDARCVAGGGRRAPRR
jgi:hypothetical protein